MKSDAKYTLCFAGWGCTALIQILMATYFMMWVTEFVHTGVLSGEDEAKTIYSNVLATGIVVSALTLPVVGKIVDVVPAYITFPLAFLTRGALIGLLYLIKDPRSNYCFFLIVSVILSSTIQYICVQALFLRNLPSHIRGVMISAFWFFGNAGCTFYAAIGGIMFDKLGASSPFNFVSICDLTVFAFAIILVCAGRINQ